MRELLLSPEVRLLTLTGPGGTGKTRLALQGSADLLEEFEDGVFFVSLATLTDPELFLPTVAATLRVKESLDKSFEESLKEYLRETDLLLLLDNFEQVLEAAPAVSGLLSAAPHLKVLATSRTPLGLYGGREYPVPPLSVPDPRRVLRVEALAHYEAVRLFIESARAVKPDFSITNGDAPAVAEICARLDGLPLAIELAAARIRMLPPRALLARLDNRLKLLTGGARDLPERQRTLRGAIEWSYDLLEESEKTLFGRLSVFAGGRTLEAIEAVCEAEGDLPVDAFEGVSSLLEKNLLRQEEGVGGEPRFVMLETIHEYAREKLEESAEAEEIKRVHAQYFLTLAEEAEQQLSGPNQVEWLDRLEAEHDNMRAALSWSLEGGEAEITLRLAGTLSQFWYRRDHSEEGLKWLEEALSLGVPAATEARTTALYGLGRMAEDQGNPERAGTAFQEALALSRAVSDERGAARSLRELGWLAAAEGDHERARSLLEESVALSRRLGDMRGVEGALEDLAYLEEAEGDPDRAAALYEEILASARRRKDVGQIASALSALGYAKLFGDDLEGAVSVTEESLALYESLGSKGGVAANSHTLGYAALKQGNHERAEKLFKESLGMSRELGAKLTIVNCLEGLAETAEARTEDARAIRLWGAAESLRESIRIPPSSLERANMEPRLAAVRDRFGEVAWEETWREGQVMPLEEAVSYALEEAGA